MGERSWMIRGRLGGVSNGGGVRGEGRGDMGEGEERKGGGEWGGMGSGIVG